jgi:hypothetical protein
MLDSMYLIEKLTIGFQITYNKLFSSQMPLEGIILYLIQIWFSDFKFSCYLSYFFYLKTEEQLKPTGIQNNNYRLSLEKTSVSEGGKDEKKTEIVMLH